MCTFFIVVREAKDVTNSLRFYKGGNKNELLRLLVRFFFFLIFKVIKLIKCYVSKLHCAR